MTDYRTFRQHGFDVMAALWERGSGHVYFHDICGFGTGDHSDIPSGWAPIFPDNQIEVDLAESWGAVAVADVALQNEDGARRHAMRAAAHARAILERRARLYRAMEPEAPTVAVA